MGNNHEGGIQTRDKIKARFGEDFYHKIGRMGGLAHKRPGGFAVMPKEKVKAAGAKGGRISRRRNSPGGTQFKENLPTILELRLKGYNLTQIAAKIGSSPHALRYHYKKYREAQGTKHE